MSQHLKRHQYTKRRIFKVTLAPKSMEEKESCLRNGQTFKALFRALPMVPLAYKCYHWLTNATIDLPMLPLAYKCYHWLTDATIGNANGTVGITIGMVSAVPEP